MMVRYLNIEEKHRQFVGSFASLLDFTLSEGEAVEAEIVLKNPGISLYCLDDATRRAIFVELPPEIDLAPAPFVYQMQYEQALRLIAVPYDTFHALAQTLPEPSHLILIFSCGRSGTTLMSHIINRLDNALSLSEPDVASQFALMRPADGSRDAELTGLINDTVRMLFKPNAFRTPTIGAIKFRSEATPALDLYHAAFPQAAALYLYRDAVSYVASFTRLFRSVQIPEFIPVEEYITMTNTLNRERANALLSYLEPGITQISTTQQASLMWIDHIEHYLEQAAPGIPVLAVNYRDLNSRREQSLEAIFRYCGLPADQVSRTLGAFEGDSQAGTILAREKPTEANSLHLTDEQISEIKRILQRHPVIKTPDFILPGTLSL